MLDDSDLKREICDALAAIRVPIQNNENRIHKLSKFQRFLPFLPLLILADAVLFLLSNNLGFSVPTLDKNMFTIYRYAPYASLLEQQNRSNRFPSVETRVKFYMSHWYAPPCPGDDSAKIKYQLLSYNSTTCRRTVVLQTIMLMEQPNNTKQSLLFQVESSTKSGHMFLLDSASLYQQKQEKENGQPGFVLHYYADDAFETIVPLMDKYLNGTPLLTQWGDSETSSIDMFDGDDAGGGRPHRVTSNPALPHLKKIRAVLDSPKDLRTLTAPACYGSESSGVRPLVRGRLQPILWKLNSRRHFQSLPRVAWNDVSWDAKVDKAVFRAGFTGSGHRPGLNRSDADICMARERCRLVLLAGKSHSPIVNAGLASMGRSGLNSIIEGVNLVRSKLSMKAQLRYKAIIMLEGNDVASGLKWALLSNSVVIMRPPTVTSWAMEELLEPWVHYIPLVDVDLTDIVEKVQWVLDHDEEARQIAIRGSLWMKDMVSHPDADSDTDEIYRDILKRYKSHFQTADDLV